MAAGGRICRRPCSRRTAKQTPDVMDLDATDRPDSTYTVLAGSGLRSRRTAPANQNRHCGTLGLDPETALLSSCLRDAPSNGGRRFHAMRDPDRVRPATDEVDIQPGASRRPIGHLLSVEAGAPKTGAPPLVLATATGLLSVVLNLKRLPGPRDSEALNSPLHCRRPPCFHTPNHPPTRLTRRCTCRPLSGARDIIDCI